MFEVAFKNDYCTIDLVYWNHRMYSYNRSRKYHIIRTSWSTVFLVTKMDFNRIVFSATFALNSGVWDCLEAFDPSENNVEHVPESTVSLAYQYPKIRWAKDFPFLHTFGLTDISGCVFLPSLKCKEQSTWLTLMLVCFEENTINERTGNYLSSTRRKDALQFEHLASICEQWYRANWANMWIKHRTTYLIRPYQFTMSSKNTGGSVNFFFGLPFTKCNYCCFLNN